METFLTTYPMFTNAQTLLTLLSKKFFEADMEKDKFTQKRIMKVLQQWFKVRQYGTQCEFDDMALASYAQTLIGKIEIQTNHPGVKKLMNLLNFRFQQKLTLPQNKDIDLTLAQLLKMGPKVIAEQLTGNIFLKFKFILLSHQNLFLKCSMQFISQEFQGVS